MINAEKPWRCTGCGMKMVRDLQADIPFASGGDYSKPIHSDSLAINPCQKEEHLKAFPNIRLDDQCRPIFDNFSAHETYMKKCNLVKEKQKVRPKGRRIR